MNNNDYTIALREMQHILQRTIMNKCSAILGEQYKFTGTVHRLEQEVKSLKDEISLLKNKLEAFEVNKGPSSAVTVTNRFLKVFCIFEVFFI